MRKRLLAAAFLAWTGSAAAADQDIFIKTPTGALWGTFETAASRRAAILVLPGSGPTNRDGNGPNFHPDTYKLLAGDLGERGIATLRIDKRGVGESASALAREEDIRFDTYVADARLWASELKSRAKEKCVWLLGHSEGALVAELAGADNSDVCGLILASGAGRKAGDIIREQMKANPNNPVSLIDAANKALDELEAGRPVADVPPALTLLFRPSVQPYLMSWLPLDPAAILAKFDRPVLILQGENDLQVSVDDAKRLAVAKPDAKLVILPGVNHILKAAPADRARNIATYGDPTLPLAPGVVDAIAQFVVR